MLRKVVEVVLGPASDPERNFIPSMISEHDFFISRYYLFPYYPQTLIFLVFQMAHLAGNAFDSGGRAFSLKPYQNPALIKSTKSLWMFLHYGGVLWQLHLCLFDNQRCQRQYEVVANIICFLITKMWLAVHLHADAFVHWQIFDDSL